MLITYGFSITPNPKEYDLPDGWHAQVRLDAPPEAHGALRELHRRMRAIVEGWAREQGHGPSVPF